MPGGPRRPPRISRFTSWKAPDVHILSPWIRHSGPSGASPPSCISLRRARVRMAASDDPACGSDSAIVPNTWPARIGPRYSFLSAAVPWASRRSAAHRVSTANPIGLEEKPQPSKKEAAHWTGKGRPSSLIWKKPRSHSSRSSAVVCGCTRTAAFPSAVSAAGVSVGGSWSSTGSTWPQSATKRSAASSTATAPACASASTAPSAPDATPSTSNSTKSTSRRSWNRFSPGRVRHGSLAKRGASALAAADDRARVSTAREPSSPNAVARRSIRARMTLELSRASGRFWPGETCHDR
mmetsp:Transcript_904/g.2800  ORF Transcript_904/g.2800 Transcript_904/m.2800 type:complete len:295 (-) Transcript_904:317-1201(-)